MISCFSLALFLVSRFLGYSQALVIGQIIVLSIFIFAYWFSTNHDLDGIILGTVCAGCISIAQIPARFRTYVTSYFITLCVMLSSSEKFHLWTVQVRSDSNTQIVFIVIPACILLVFSFMKKKMDLRQNHFVEQNNELETLNITLEDNIREKEQAIRELRKTQQQLIESEKMASIGHFTAGIAHELNNPLNFMAGSIRPIHDYLENIKQLNEQNPETLQYTEDSQNLLELLEKGTNHISETLKNFIKISPGKNTTIKRRRVDLQDLMKNTYHFVKTASADIEMELVLNEKMEMMALPVEINQILFNLIKNSIDAVRDKPDGLIQLKMVRQGSMGVIRISDNGVGISQKNLNYVFDPFYTTKEPGKGTGVGLYIVYSLVKKYRGDIRIESTKGVGTEIHLSLPVLPPTCDN